MTSVYLVTLAVDLTGVRASEAAAMLLAEEAVVTVRIADAGAPSVVRLDIDAATERQAARAARELVTAVGRRLHCALSIQSAHGVLDSERLGMTGRDRDHI
jgi:hypothetical protein